MRQGGARRIPGFARQIEAKFLTRLQIGTAVVKPSDSKLGSLQIDQDSDGPSDLLLDLTDRLESAPMIGMGSMAEIEAKDIGPGLEHGPNALRAVGSRAKCGEDFRLALSSHARGSTSMARKSFTFVRVGPVTTRSFSPAKKL